MRPFEGWQPYSSMMIIQDVKESLVKNCLKIIPVLSDPDLKQ